MNSNSWMLFTILPIFLALTLLTVVCWSWISEGGADDKKLDPPQLAENFKADPSADSVAVVPVNKVSTQAENAVVGDPTESKPPLRPNRNELPVSMA